MQGLHLTADLHGCDARRPLMHDLEALRRHCLQAVHAAGLQAVGELFHRFPVVDPEQAPGITGVVLLAESHLAVHTWPEREGVTVDAYVCNVSRDDSQRAQRLIDAVVAGFGPQRQQRQTWRRGDEQAASAVTDPAIREAAEP